MNKRDAVERVAAGCEPVADAAAEESLMHHRSGTRRT
jgi:hypothetical protein